MVDPPRVPKTQKPKAAGEEEAAAPSPLQSSAWGKNGQPVPRWNHLDNFHKRYNKVGYRNLERCLATQ